LAEPGGSCQHSLSGYLPELRVILILGIAVICLRPDYVVVTRRVTSCTHLLRCYSSSTWDLLVSGNKYQKIRILQNI